MKRYAHVKRIFDIILGSLLAIILLPLFLLLSLLIKIDSKGPVLFKQKRVGKDQSYFYIFKFRTMKIDTPDLPTHLLSHPETYITKVGRVLRRSSLDELPQLFNIIKGDMSFVGPRPALWTQEDLISQREGVGVNKISPGLTGWAQVNGRDELEISVKVVYDKEYLEKMSFLFDLRIVILTIKSVFTAKGIVEGRKEKEEVQA